MGVLSVFYAGFGYLALLAAILWGMLFVGDGATVPTMDATATAAPLEASLADLGLLLLLALLHCAVTHGILRHLAWRSIPARLERSTRAWVAAGGLGLIYAAWQSLPQILWTAPEPLQWALSFFFYLAWTSAFRRSPGGAQDRFRTRGASRLLTPGRARRALAHYPCPANRRAIRRPAGRQYVRPTHRRERPRPWPAAAMPRAWTLPQAPPPRLGPIPLRSRASHRRSSCSRTPSPAARPLRSAAAR